jgi:hypothetical protein
MQRLLEPHEVQAILDRAVEEAEQQIFFAIKTIPEDRHSLLAQLDALEKVKDRINGRIEHPDPNT